MKGRNECSCFIDMFGFLELHDSGYWFNDPFYTKVIHFLLIFFTVLEDVVPAFMIIRYVLFGALYFLLYKFCITKPTLDDFIFSFNCFTDI